MGGRQGSSWIILDPSSARTLQVPFKDPPARPHPSISALPPAPAERQRTPASEGGLWNPQAISQGANISLPGIKRQVGRAGRVPH